jgi:hypothetical protein
MAHYEVVGDRGKAKGCDYLTADSLEDAKLVLGDMAARKPPYEMVFVRQYRKDQLRGKTFRVLHKLTWTPE